MPFLHRRKIKVVYATHFLCFAKSFKQEEIQVIKFNNLFKYKILQMLYIEMTIFRKTTNFVFEYWSHLFSLTAGKLWEKNKKEWFHTILSFNLKLTTIQNNWLKNGFISFYQRITNPTEVATYTLHELLILVLSKPEV